MKHIETQILSNIKFQDDVEIVNHPVEGVPCIFKNGKYYSPSIIWLEYQDANDEENGTLISLSSNDSEDINEGGVWIELDEEEEEELISEVFDEYIEFRELNKEEIEDLESDDEE